MFVTAANCMWQLTYNVDQQSLTGSSALSALIQMLAANCTSYARSVPAPVRPRLLDAPSGIPAPPAAPAPARPGPARSLRLPTPPALVASSAAPSPAAAAGSKPAAGSGPKAAAPTVQASGGGLLRIPRLTTSTTPASSVVMDPSPAAVAHGCSTARSSSSRSDHAGPAPLDMGDDGEEEEGVEGAGKTLGGEGAAAAEESIITQEATLSPALSPVGAGLPDARTSTAACGPAPPTALAALAAAGAAAAVPGWGVRLPAGAAGDVLRPPRATAAAAALAAGPAAGHHHRAPAPCEPAGWPGAPLRRPCHCYSPCGGSGSAGCGCQLQEQPSPWGGGHGGGGGGQLWELGGGWVRVGTHRGHGLRAGARAGRARVLGRGAALRVVGIATSVASVAAVTVAAVFAAAALNSVGGGG